jgi:DNA replication protein
MLINSLTEKDLLEIKVDKNNSYCTEEISLEKLYQKLGFLLVNQEEKKEDSTNLYSIFEQEFGRTISPMEYEIINAWKSSDFTDELIISALKEATYNGVTNLRYIDKILHEWKKKGIKTSKDVELDKQNFNKKNNKKVNLIDYDWLNENE